EDRQRRVRIEDVGVVDVGRALVRLGKGRHLHVYIDAESLAHIDLAIRRGQNRVVAIVALDVRNLCHCNCSPTETEVTLQQGLVNQAARVGSAHFGGSRNRSTKALARSSFPITSTPAAAGGRLP